MKLSLYESSNRINGEMISSTVLSLAVVNELKSLFMKSLVWLFHWFKLDL